MNTKMLLWYAAVDGWRLSLIFLHEDNIHLIFSHKNSPRLIVMNFDNNFLCNFMANGRVSIYTPYIVHRSPHTNLTKFSGIFGFNFYCSTVDDLIIILSYILLHLSVCDCTACWFTRCLAAVLVELNETFYSFGARCSWNTFRRIFHDKYCIRFHFTDNDNGLFDIYSVFPFHKTKLYVIPCFHLKDNIIGQHK